MATSICGFPSTFQGMYYSQIQQLETSIRVFERVELCNVFVSTQHGNGNLAPKYYVFSNMTELALYNQGAVVQGTLRVPVAPAQKN